MIRNLFQYTKFVDLDLMQKDTQDVTIKIKIYADNM